jgi:alcohol dehydrogenase YqhD (iron-dependent ADH family)
MRKFEYCSPTRIVFGSGAENETGRLARDCGAHRAFIVYGGGSAVKSGLIAKVEKSLASAGIEYEAMGGVVPNPVLSTARAMVAKASAFGADFILAVGGGSVIDTAKAVAHGTANPGTDVWDIWMHGSQLKKSLPIGAVLTIAAAGSETSDSAVITNDTVEPFSKRGLSVELNRCRFAVMDPDLTMTLPPFQVGAGAADIFMHTSERYFTHITGNHPDR